jgi:hypothetical protein
MPSILYASRSQALQNPRTRVQWTFKYLINCRWIAKFKVHILWLLAATMRIDRNFCKSYGSSRGKKPFVPFTAALAAMVE